MPLSPPSVDEVISEAAFARCLPDDTERLRQEREDIEKAAKLAVTTMALKPTAYREHIAQIRNFLSVLWRKYDCEDLMEVVSAYTRVEPILLDLERDEASGYRYRDHSVHSFNVFLFGLRLLGKVVDTVGDDAAQVILKVKPERINDKIPRFRNWSYGERLFYLWTLMSTFHDIAIPLEHLGRVESSLNDFAKKFGLEIVGPSLRLDALYPALDWYLQRLATLFAGELRQDEEGLEYDDTRDDIYVETYLRKKLQQRDHGVLSGLLLYRKIEEIFFLLRGKAKDAFGSSADFAHYHHYVLQQDVARASLAISLHNLELETGGAPLFLPIRFETYPLAFILILSDGLQEYLRWEGTSIEGATKFCCFPSLHLTREGDGLQLEVGFFLTGADAEKEYLRQQAGIMAARRGMDLGDKPGVPTAAAFLLESLYTELECRIDLKADFKVVLKIFQPGGLLARYPEEGRYGSAT